MVEGIADRLAQRGLVLPKLAAPLANYLPYCMHQGLLFVSGQLPLVDGKLTRTGKLGESVSIEDGKRAAEICALNILAQAEAATGDLERILRVVRVTVFVASAPDFVDQPAVANGASDLLVDLLGDRGRHARAAVGMASLPMNAPVEVDAIIACEP
ncbi:RidA family protein [Propylenella binzhouense]|uniref:RidA family protein n=1 Tax=Propylenella binzhouense TaxID=2555902 RepID=A0A964WS73_9HYPH|nr:RidA family protein [Propylenella binzhouense]MYZ46668.1 RidA family protein [Propylenella binzhouense]